jgi:hypothetical protein
VATELKGKHVITHQEGRYQTIDDMLKVFQVFKVFMVFMVFHVTSVPGVSIKVLFKCLRCS